MKIFLFLQISHYNGQWPYINNYWFKGRYWATEEEILALNLSESIKKRIRSAKVGTLIKIRHQSSSSDIYFKRAADDYIEKRESLEALLNKKVKINKEIRLKCAEEYDRLKELEKEEKVIRTEIFKIDGLK